MALLQGERPGFTPGRSHPTADPVAEGHDDAMVTLARTVRKDVLRNRALLLESADALIREQGMELSLNAVARRAGVGVGTVYRHFPDREALIQALFEQRVEQVHVIMTAHLADDDAVEGLRAAIFGICQMQEEDRGIWEVLSSGSREAHRETVQARLLPVAEELVSRANASGRLRVEFDPNDLPIVLWMGGALNAYLGGVSKTGWRRYIQIMFDSFLTDDDPSRRPLAEPPLAPDEIDAAMQTWRPRGMAHD